jgi:von Hippel-Lindau disease tumor supressor
MSRCACGLLCLAVLGIAFSSGFTALFRAEKKHPAEEKGIKSINSDVETKITFANKSGKTIKVFWLDFDGKRKFYQTLEDDESYDQDTYLTHPWVITDEDDNAWYVYYPDAQPRTVEVVAPKQKEK